MRFDQNKAGQIIPLAEGRPCAVAVLRDARGNIGGDADIENALWLVGQDVGVAASRHAASWRAAA